MTPTMYKRGGEGMTINFTTAPSAVGRVLVAATERGICRVSIGDDDGALEAALEAEYPRAWVHRDDQTVSPFLGPILDHVREQHTLATLPLDVQGTPFQRQVWSALRTIPAGERRSYSEVAAQIGHPGAARAVASACAANPVALVIPCHRVVRASGEVGGYRWGASRKQNLLDAELKSGGRKQEAEVSRAVEVAGSTRHPATADS
jgi:AraC family transcriptional regulator, regulatory protein of adaptative response / methylated-DNA-[protein]-cysteine methyltransferase